MYIDIDTDRHADTYLQSSNLSLAVNFESLQSLPIDVNTNRAQQAQTASPDGSLNICALLVW